MKKGDDGADPLITSKKSEAELLTLENEIEKLKQRLRLLQSEERAEMEEKEEKMKENRDIIRELQSQIDYLRIQLNRGKLGDEKILKKAFQKHPTEIGIMKGKRAHEVIDIMEGRVFDMTKKRDTLRYEVQKKQNALNTLKDELREMERKCALDDDDTDQDIIDRAREVENEFQAAQMRILEMQQIERIYQEIQDKLSADLMTLPSKLEELEKEFHMQQTEIDRLVKREKKADHSREKAKAELAKAETAAQQARQEKDKIMAEFSHVVEQKQARMADPDITRRRASAFIPSKLKAEEELNQMKQQQEEQLAKYKAAFEQIKIATGVTDIEDAEKRFASQRAIRDNLLELNKHSEKLLNNMKKEKKHLEAQRETMLGANLATPEKVLKEEIDKWKFMYEEQKQRKKAAEIEYERLTKTIADAKSSLWHILQMMEYHLLDKKDQSGNTMPDIPLTELAEKVQHILRKITKRLEGYDLETLIQQMKDEQPFLKKLEEERLGDIMPRKKGKPQAVEEESSSEDEEIRKRSELKKEAQGFADIKQKQKGRGRGLKL